MDFQSLSFIFNRAWQLTASKKKNGVVFSLLVLVGILVTAFRGLALHAGSWVQLGLTFLPLLMGSGLLLFLGVLLICCYRKEVKEQEISYKEIFAQSWIMATGASYFAIPLIFSYLFLWILLGIFILLTEIPTMGSFFSIVFSFIPFLIHLAMLLLCVIAVVALFFLAPAIAFKGLQEKELFQSILLRLQKAPFTHVILFLIALLPVVLVIGLLLSADVLTYSISTGVETPLQRTLQSLFIMIPFAAFLSPSILFFFNFSAESYVFTQKK